MYSIRVQNLDETIAALRGIDRGMVSELKKAIKEIAQPTLDKARGYASGLGSNPTGRYASSLALRTYSNGVKFISSDPGGGVIEFANPGALILEGPRAGRRAGVPHGSTPPRALLRAILDDEETIVAQVSQKVQDVIDEELIGLG